MKCIDCNEDKKIYVCDVCKECWEIWKDKYNATFNPFKKYINDNSGDYYTVDYLHEDKVLLTRWDLCDLIEVPLEVFEENYTVRPQYMVITHYWNGYGCGCCGIDEDLFEIFQDLKKLKEYIKDMPRERVDGMYLKNIYEIKEIDL